MASSDCLPVPRKNVAYRVVFGIYNNTGALVSGAAGLDSEVSKDQGTFADCTNEATEIATSSGIYYLDLTSTEMNADCSAVIVKTSTTDAKTTVIVLYPQETGDIKVDVQSLLGTAWLTPGTAGTPDVNVKLWNALATVDLPLAPTTAGRKLDVSSGGEAGVDWANVGSPTTALGLTNTTVGTLTTYTGNTPQTGDSFARLGAAGAGLTALGDARIANLDATMSSRTKPADTQAAVTLVTTATNLTNAPTVGDFTAVMKTSIGTAVAASAVASVTAGVTLTNAGIDGILDRSAGVETSFTLRQALRLILSSAVAKLSGAATTTVLIRDINDTKNRVTATVDASGNRTAVTTDVS